MDTSKMLYMIMLMGIGLQCGSAAQNGSMESKPQVVRVGVILNMASTVGNIANSYISMAVSDFYAMNSNYRTRLALSVKDSDEDVVEAASEALELMNNEQVDAIIGPQTSTEAKFVIDLGDRAQIPIISFSATSPSLSSAQNPFFIRTAHDDCSQAKALASIVEAYGWKEVVLIYEDTEYGKGLIPYLTDAFQVNNIRVPYRCIVSPNSNQFQVLKQLNMVMSRETRILLVHVSPLLGSKLFQLAKQIGMMSEGYAWIITDGLSSLLHPLEGKSFGSMDGVVGVRPYLPESKQLRDFKTRWNKTSGDINLFGLWAYDTVWALAMAAELVSPNSLISYSSSINSIGPFSLRVSDLGPRLLQKLLQTKFEGLSGEFNLIRGQLEPTDYEIINVRGKLGERVIGYWSLENGSISYGLDQYVKIKRTPIIWPGNTKVPPKGWVKPVFGKKLRIGVPITPAGYKEFLKIEWDPHTDEPSFSGFSYEIFLAALDKLPFSVPHMLLPFTNSSRQNNGTYDELLYYVKLKKFDAVIGDTTIVANRTKYVDFTLPYTESGVSMVVKVKKDETKSIWIFLKPLRWDLWLSIGVAFIFTAIVIWFLELQSNEELRCIPRIKLSGTILWFSISTLVFSNREKLENKWSRFVLVVWLFVVLIFTQSYTASLASMLTVQKLQPAIADINELRTNDNYFVGHLKNSYVKGLLIEQLKFSESRLRSYASPEEYDDAMSKGSQNGGVDAIFEEIPYVKVFLSKYCSKYKVVGPTYKSAGFGFAFPIGSPLVSYISKAILNITQDPNKMQQLETKYFELGTKCEDPNPTFSSDDDDPSLGIYSFSGLLMITGMASVFSYLIHLIKLCFNRLSAANVIHPDSSLCLWPVVTKRENHCHIDLHSNLHARAEVSVNHADHLHNPPTGFVQETVDINKVGEQDEYNYMDYIEYVYGCA